MAHCDEMTCLLYLDGQLDSLRSSELELHLRSCTPCRSLLGALERESGFLQSAMTEEDESVPARLLSAPQPDRVPWGWLSLLGGTSGGLYSLYAFVIEPWQANLSTAGFGGGNLLTTLFFQAAFWKGWTDVINLIVMISTALLGLPLLWFAWKNVKRMKPVAMVLATLAGLLALPAPAGATQVHRDRQSFTVPAGETIKEDLIIMTGSARIEGTVEGDVIVFGASVTVTGRITGDLIVFAQRLRVEGQIDGDVRGFANQVDIAGSVARSITSFSEGFDLTDRATVGGSVMFFAARGDLDGKIGRDLFGFLGKGRINGQIQGEARLRGEDVRFSTGSSVGGKIIFRGRQQPEILNKDLLNKLEFTADREDRPNYAKPGYYWRQGLRYGAAFFFGLVFLLVFPGFYGDIQRQSKRYGPALGVGLLAYVATPILACIAIITLVGMAVGIGGLLLWMVLWYASQVIVAAWLGSRVWGETADTAGRIGRLALGLAIVRVIGAIPPLWFFVWVVILPVWGMGAFTLALIRNLREGMDAATPSAAAQPAPAITG
jgi:cytoskeletal protein CcmA (bactofilin family)